METIEISFISTPRSWPNLKWVGMPCSAEEGGATVAGGCSGTDRSIEANCDYDLLKTEPSLK